MTADQLFKTLLQRVAQRERRCRLWVKLAGCWVATDLLALIVLVIERQTGWAFSLASSVFIVMAIGAAVVLLIQNARTEPDWRHLARLIESRYPQLDGRLLTAVQQNANAGQELNYLQQRVLEETLRYSHQNDWANAIPKSRVVLAQTAHWLALILCGSILWKLPSPEKHGLLARISDVSVTVTPGDTSLERGSSLVVLARFGGPLPSVVELVTSQPAKAPGRATGRIQLVKSLADPIFGGSIPEIATNLLYHVEYAGQR